MEAADIKNPGLPRSFVRRKSKCRLKTTHLSKYFSFSFQLNDNHTHTDSGLKVTGFILKMNFRKIFLKKNGNMDYP